MNMVRTRVKGTVVRQSSSPEEEPHFEKMEPIGTHVNGQVVPPPPPQSISKDEGVKMEDEGVKMEDEAPTSNELTPGKTFYPVKDDAYMNLHPWGLKYMQNILPKGLIYGTKYSGSRDNDLIDFLAEIDLESDNEDDECYESEEAMARILEEEVTQVSAV